MRRGHLNLAGLAVACSLVIVGAPATAAPNDTPHTSSTEGWPRPIEPSSSRFREYVEHLANLFIRTPPALGMPPKAIVESKVVAWQWPRTQVLFGMHMRRTAGSDRMVGSLSAADTFAFTQQGIMLAGRVGVERGAFRMYGIGGAGGLQLVSYQPVVLESERFDTQPQVTWSGLLGGGLGAEMQLSSSTSLGTEYDVAMLTASPGTRVFWPDPRLVIRSWWTGLKVVY